MTNFLRVVRHTLRRKYTFAAAMLCSFGVAALWGANLGLIKPIIDIVFSDKPPHDWADDRVEASKKRDAEIRHEIVLLDAQINAAGEKVPEKTRLQRARLDTKLMEQQTDIKNWRWRARMIKRWLPNSAFATLAVFVSILIVATLVKDILLVGNLMLVERLTQLGLFDMRKKLFRKTLSMEMAHFGNDHTSHLMHRFTGDINCAFTGVNILIGRMILEPLKMLACLIGAAMISWRLLIVSLLIAPLAAYIMMRLSRSLKKANRRAMEEMGKLYELLSEAFSGIQAVKAFGMERYERRRFHTGGKNFYRKAMRIMFLSALGRGGAEFMGMTIMCLAIIVGAYLVINGETKILGVTILDKPMQFGSLMAFYALLIGISDPARKMSEVMGILQRGVVASDRLYDALDLQPKIVDPEHPRVVTDSRPTLSFNNLSFQYPRSSQLVLNEVNLTIPFGETIALVGPNGCGKTTLAHLLPRFYDPMSGSIMIGGIDLRQMRLKDLRSMLGVVAQQATLFDDTVMTNIRYGSPHATDEQVIAAAEKAYAHRFIVEKLDNGYQTEVGERGGRLSGGQRQRVLLARAILRDPKILILDEATSQIDLESEQLIHKVLEQFRKGRTTLMITHRMSSIALADRIVVMDAGQILAIGTHQELLGQCELYTRLHELGFRQAA